MCRKQARIDRKVSEPGRDTQRYKTPEKSLFYVSCVSTNKPDTLQYKRLTGERAKAR